MQIAYEQLALTQQLLQRQDEHAQAIRTYVTSNCNITADLGYLLAALAPLAALSVTLGDQAAAALGKLTVAGANAAGATLDSYVEADRAAHDSFTAIAGEIGGSSEPFADPRDSPPLLSCASGGPGAGYGEGREWIFGHAYDGIGQAGDVIGNTIDTATDRVNGWTAGSGGVAERTNPSGFLVAPDPGGAWVQDLRWSAGIILGGLDWVAEQFIGFSVLEESVFKPFGGDWEALNKASIAWGHSGRALMEMSSNLSALPDQVDSWEGEASEMFRAAVAALAAATVGLSYAFDYVGGLVGNVATVSKLVCTAIGVTLGFISTNLLVIAAEAAVPVIGWAAAAAHIVVVTGYVITAVKGVYELINLILDAIEAFIESKEKLIQAIFVLEDIVEYSAKASVRAAG